MRRLALAVLLLASPAFARARSDKRTPKQGDFCSKRRVGSTATDAKGQTLTCKADSKGRFRWGK